MLYYKRTVVGKMFVLLLKAIQGTLIEKGILLVRRTHSVNI